ncbi:MAG: DUF4091 domain-containing protein [Acidobacteria bacterium]|nr:DUF4091 domain-containing protein [Acidobacteriota bacterium]MBI3661919.1 DUF4091 domain-containing protein [Acidobacteriota bacterium]
MSLPSRQVFDTNSKSAGHLWAIVLIVALGLLQTACGGGFAPPGSQPGFGNNAGGGGGGTITVPPAGLRLTLSPASASVAPGGQVQLNAVIQNATNPTLNWAVNGVPGGNLTVGTISSTGAYQAPTVAPTPNTVTVTVTSQQDPTKSASSLIVITTPPTPVSVSVSPATATLQTGSVTAFNALVTGTINTAVTWSVNGVPGGSATVGTITAAGVYTAPASVPAPATVSVTATSAADPTASGAASVTIQQRVQVSVSPGSAQVLTTASQQYTAAVSGTANMNVTWGVNGIAGGNATFGTIDNTGLYTGPNAVPTPTTVTISATSVVDPTAIGFASATILLSPGVTVTVTPASATVSINQTLQLTATVAGLFRGLPPSQQVTWYVSTVVGGNQTVGFISPAGLYTAPAAVPFPNTVTIQAFSVTDNTAVGTAVVTITAPTLVTVTVAPATTSVQVGTSQTFSATVGGTSNTAVSWSVNGIPGGNATVGTITAAGIYTAPASVPSPATVTVTATSSADPSASSTAQATILAAPVPIAVSVNPGSASLNLQQQLQFNATLTGTTNQAVTWAVNGVTGGNATVGTVSAAGVYTAPATLPSPATVTVRATSVADNTKFATASVTLLPPSTISLTPSATTVQVGLGAQFFATVTGVANTAVNWAVNGIVGGNSTVGTIDANGLYIAPAAVPTPNPVSITATSVANSNLVATSTATIAVPVTVTVAPATATLALSATQQFTATVTGTANTAVTWSVNGIAGGNATVGTIDNTGFYTAPASLLLSGNFTITATSAANPTQTGTASVLVTVPVAVSISPLTPSVQVSNTQQFSATVTGTANTAVTWSVTGAGCVGPACGTITAGGLYAAPVTAPAPNTVTVKATSVADITKFASTTVTITTPPISVSVNPATATVSANGSLQFAATVANSSNQSVTWTVTGTGCAGPACGAISAAGLYTAPALAPTPNTVTVTATSVADNTKSASATVTILAVVSVTVSPTTASVLAGGTQQFTDTVTGTTNTAVTWSVTGSGCAGATCGTISATGLYTAPTVAPTPNTVTVRATSVADNTKFATAAVTISIISVTVNPAIANVSASGSLQFSAVVNGSVNQSVTWSVTGTGCAGAACGTITAAGLYTAPAVAPAPNTVTVQATSVADSTKSATSTVTIVAVIAVSVSPSSANVLTNGTQQFTATVTGSANTSVAWDVNGVAGGNATVGTISAAGLYTAPAAVPSPATVTVRATSAADNTKSATSSVTIAAPVISVSVNPGTASVSASGSVQFNATVSGTANQSVTWTVTGAGCAGAACGAISAAGFYTAPAIAPFPASVTVTATSVADNTKSAIASVTIVAIIAVAVSPNSATVLTGATQQFTATVTGSANTIVTWSVSGSGCSGIACGTVSATGLYTAPGAVPSPATVSVTATSVADGTKSASATVTVAAPISVSVAPAIVSLVTSQSQQFTATVSGTTNQTVTWSVNGVVGGNAANGTISPSGFYRAPALVPTPNTITITATSAADSTKTASATVTITSPPVGVLVFVFPKNRNLPIGRTQQFTAEVIRAPNNAVNWTIGGTGCAGAGNPCGTISATGLYTPPATPPAPASITITATSQVDATASQTVNAKIVVGVSISPSSAKLNPKGTQQFTAAIAGSANTSVTWAVVGSGCSLPGNPCGTISATGLYTAPSFVPRPGMFTITSTSAADPTEPGVATIEILPASVQISPATVQVLPGGQMQFIAVTNIYPPPVSTQPVLTWSVNGVVGGNATLGTISTSGLYIAPQTVPTPASITVAAASTVTPTTTASSTVTIGAPTGASPVTLLPSLQKVRPYDVPTGAATLTVTAAGNQYASWQVLIEGRNEDLTGVDVTLSDFTDTSGNRITAASNAVIYLEKFINVPYVSRAQSVPGEWPDPLVPKKDPFANEVRNAFPFGVNRISPAHKIYPRLAGDTVNTGMGDGRVAPGGVSTASSFRFFVVTIDRAGTIGAGSATFKWSNDGGVTFQQINQPIPNSNAIPLSDGVTIAFQPGTVTGVTDFNVGDTYWIFAGPIRQQPVWIDLFVPSTAPAGAYTGTVTVMRSGKTNVTLTVTLNVKNFVLPVSSSIPAFFGMNWTSLLNAHYLATSGSQTLALGQLYGQACLINRISCDTVSNFQPVFTFNPDGSIATFDYSTFDQATGPLANGTITPRNEQLSLIRLPRVGSTASQQYFATQHMLGEFGRRGWRARAFDFSYDEPVTSSDFLAAMDRVSLVRAVDPLLRATVTADISKFNYNLIGYNNVWTPNWTTLENKEFFSGPNPSARAFYDAPLATGDELWWYESCLTHGCGSTGASPQHDNYPNFNVDVPALFNRSWGFSAIQPYGVTGLFGQNAVLAYSRFFQMAAPRVDVWDSVYYLGGNGDGTLFYPGRPSDIGGTTHVPVESLRLKMIRDALVDQEVAIFLQNRGDGPFVADTIFQEAKNLTSVLADPNLFVSSSRALINQAGSPPLPPPINVPAAGGCYTDPVTGNRVCRVTDRALCARAAHHFYSYWPIWNQTGTHMIVECLSWSGAPLASSTAILVRDSDLAVLGNVLAGMPAGVSLKTSNLFWAWNNPNKFFGYGTGASKTQLWEWNPFTKTGALIKDFAGLTFFGRSLTSITLSYVSFDDNYFLLEGNDTTGLTTILFVYDRLANTVLMPGLDLNQFPYYDESVMTKANKPYVRANDSSNIPQAWVYSLDFTTKIRPSEGGHHAHGLLPNGTPVLTKASSNRSCPAGSISGVPGSSWKPTAVVVDETVDTTGAGQNADPLASVFLKLGCGVPGQHNFDHWSWNNTQKDRFFNSSLSYSGFASDPIAFGILRFRLQFNALGNITGDQIDLLAHHRSDDTKYGYFAKPRASCNQQGSRCIFSSTMTIQTNNLDPQEHLYVVDGFPP